MPKISLKGGAVSRAIGFYRSLTVHGIGVWEFSGARTACTKFDTVKLGSNVARREMILVEAVVNFRRSGWSRTGHACNPYSGDRRAIAGKHQCRRGRRP